MPCRNDYDSPNTIEVENPRTIQKLDDVTALLCDLCLRLTTQNQGKFLAANPKLLKWWYDHKEKDEKQRKKELDEKKRTALNKLTKEERKLLGI